MLAHIDIVGARYAAFEQRNIDEVMAHVSPHAHAKTFLLRREMEIVGA